MGLAWKRGIHIISSPFPLAPVTRPHRTAGEARRCRPVVCQEDRRLAWDMTAALKHDGNSHGEERAC